MDCCATWVTFMFLQASVQILFWNPITVRWQDILESTRWWSYCKSTFISQNFDKISANILDCAPLVPLPNQPLRRRDCTHPYQSLTNLGILSQWITCLAYHPQIMAMIVFLWLLIDSLKWPFWQLARRISWLRPRPRSSLIMYGFILGSHWQSFLIKIAGSSVHFGPAYGHCWTPSSPNPLPSIPKLMVRQRW